jgi:hypothetical protein
MSDIKLTISQNSMIAWQNKATWTKPIKFILSNMMILNSQHYKLNYLSESFNFE